MNLWKTCYDFNGVLYPSIEEHDKSLHTKLVQLEMLKDQGLMDRIVITKILNNMSNILRFRVTCNRVGKHSFGSMEAARDFGGKLHDIFHWVIDLTTFNIDIVLNIINGKYNQYEFKFLYYSACLYIYIY